MILAVDIGNTNVNIALMGKKGRIARRFSVPTGKRDLGGALSAVRKKNIECIIVVSVVPEALAAVKRRLKKVFRGKRILTVGKDVRVPLKCAYDKREIGQDRLVTAFAAGVLHSLPVLIIDFGTAVTFDAVSASGTYLGGLIMPGIKMSLESLSERTALLPRTFLKGTRSFIGKDTSSSIRSGMIYGYSSLCEGIIKLFKKEIGKNIKVIATGGDATLISRYTPSLKTVDLDLSLKGLFFLTKF